MQAVHLRTFPQRGFEMTKMFGNWEKHNCIVKNVLMILFTLLMVRMQLSIALNLYLRKVIQPNARVT